jgi:hypothetical protein
MCLKSTRYTYATMFAMGLVVGPSALFAQGVNPNVPGLLTVPKNVNPALFAAQPEKARAELRARDTRSDLQGDPRPRETTVPLNETSVLSGFRLGFANGDHPVKQVTVMRDGAMARGVLADNNGDDNYRFSATWWNIPGVVSGEISAVAGFYAGFNGVYVPEGPPNSTLALVGFSLQVPEDNEVYGLKVELDTSSRKAVFALETTGSTRQEVRYTIQYAWVPNAALAGNFTVTGGGLGARARMASGVSGTLPNSDRSILRGFSLRYDDSSNSAQNLLALGVSLAPSPNPNIDRDVVDWQDNDRNERIRWRVDYSVLK